MIATLIQNEYNPPVQGWVLNCNCHIELSSRVCASTCMHDGWCFVCVCAAAKKWRSSGSGGCRSSRVPRSSWLLGRARVELEPRIRCRNNLLCRDENLVWSQKDCSLLYRHIYAHLEWSSTTTKSNYSLYYVACWTDTRILSYCKWLYSILEYSLVMFECSSVSIMTICLLSEQYEPLYEGLYPNHYQGGLRWTWLPTVLFPCW